MERFRIFYFRDSVLAHAEELHVRDLLDALDLARGTEPDVRAEIWSERGRVGMIGPRPAGR